MQIINANNLHQVSYNQAWNTSSFEVFMANSLASFKLAKPSAKVVHIIQNLGFTAGGSNAYCMTIWYTNQ